MDKQPLLIMDDENKIWEITMLLEGPEKIERYLYTSLYKDQSAQADKKIRINSFIYPFNIVIDTQGYLRFELEDYYG